MTRSKRSFRPIALLTALVVGAVILGARLVWIQGLASERYSDLAAEQRERRYVLAAQRGSIYDRQGAELAISIDMQTIFANPKFVHDPNTTAAALAPLLGPLGIDAGTLKSKLTKKSGFVYLARKVAPDIAGQVVDLGLPGVEAAPESKRFYPAGALASHVLGFTGVDNEGLAGVEDRYERTLKGHPGEIFVERDPTGRPIPAGKSRLRPPVSGKDLVLTLDREIQWVAEEALRRGAETWSAEAGSVIVIRPSTGEVLALANFPTFDPNSFTSATSSARRNRALMDVFEPGSANKVITAAAAIESKVVSPNDVINVPDKYRLGSKVFHDAHPHEVLDLTFSGVIQQSSNVGTIKVAQKIGKDRLYEYLKKFGYGRRTGIDFTGESAGILPKPEGWWETSLPTIAIGQGVAVTALQIVQVYAAVANEGISVEPRLIHGVVDASGRLRRVPTATARRVIKPETAKTLTEMLIGVTQDRHGTGRAAAIRGYEVAGKTGTAQKVSPGGGGYQGYVGSFIGFAPAGDPQVVVGVILDNPSPIWGGVTAAPIFKEVMEFALRHLGIGPGPVLRPSQGGAGTPLPTPDRSGGAASDVATIAPPAEGATE